MSKKQYHQAHKTPFGSGPLATLLGRTGNTITAKRILSGDIDNRPLCHLPETARVLQTLAKDYPSSQGTAIISDTDFVGTYKAAKESTNSSPSGRHIGHYNAILKDPVLVGVHATMMSIPFQVGIVPDRWKKVLDIMLKKTQGDSDATA